MEATKPTEQEPQIEAPAAEAMAIPTSPIAASSVGMSSSFSGGSDWMDMITNTTSTYVGSPSVSAHAAAAGFPEPQAHSRPMVDEPEPDTQELRSKNTQLSLKLETMESKLSQSEASQAELLDRLRKQQDTMGSVQKQTNLVQRLEEEKRRIEDELETLKGTVRDLKDQIREANRKENDSSAEKLRLQQVIEARDRELTELEKKMAGLASKVDEDAAAKSIAKLRAAAEAAEKQAQERIDQLTKEKEALEAKLAEVAKVNQTLQTKQVQTEQALDDAKRKLKDAEAAASAASTSTPNRKKGSLLSEIAEADKAPSAELEQKVQVLEELRVLLEQEKADLASRLQALEAEKKSLLEQLAQKAATPSADPAMMQHLAELEQNIKKLETDRRVEVEKKLEQSQKIWEQEKQQLGVQFEKMMEQLKQDKSYLETSLLNIKQENEALKAKALALAASQSNNASGNEQIARPIPLIDNSADILAELNDMRLIKSSLEDEVKKLKDQLTLATLKAKSLRQSRSSESFRDDIPADEPLLSRRAQKKQEECCACCTIC